MGFSLSRHSRQLPRSLALDVSELAYSGDKPHRHFRRERAQHLAFGHVDALDGYVADAFFGETSVWNATFTLSGTAFTPRIFCSLQVTDSVSRKLA